MLGREHFASDQEYLVYLDIKARWQAARSVEFNRVLNASGGQRVQLARDYLLKLGSDERLAKLLVILGQITDPSGFWTLFLESWAICDRTSPGEISSLSRLLNSRHIRASAIKYHSASNQKFFESLPEITRVLSGM